MECSDNGLPRKMFRFGLRDDAVGQCGESFLVDGTSVNDGYLYLDVVTKETLSPATPVILVVADWNIR